MKEDIKIAAAYIRVSTDRQDEYSPDSQRKLIYEYANREGYIVPDEYIFYDDGISARSTKNRTEFNRMISMAKEKKPPFEAILVWKFSRFARNREESMVFKNLLRKKGIKVISISEPIPEDHYGTLLEGIIEWYDEFYSINLGVEVKRGLAEKLSRGEPTRPPAFGYIMKDKRYYPDWSGPAQIVQEMFRKYDSGVKLRSIATWLNEIGSQTRYGNEWQQREVDYVLHNPLYIGKLRKSADGTHAVSRRKYNSGNIEVIDGLHEAIIDIELWDRVQAKLDAAKRTYSKYARSSDQAQWMLKGLVRCSNCGGTLTTGARYGRNGKMSLQCCNYSHGTCMVSHSVLYEKIEEAFFLGLEEALANQTFAIEPVVPKEESDSTPNYDRLLELNRRKLERARQAFLAEIDTIEQYAENKRQIEADIKALEEAKAKQPPPTRTDPAQFAKKVAEVIEFLRSPDVSVQAKNEAIRTIVSKIVYEKEKQNLAIFFCL